MAIRKDIRPKPGGAKDYRKGKYIMRSKQWGV